MNRISAGASGKKPKESVCNGPVRALKISHFGESTCIPTLLSAEALSIFYVLYVVPFCDVREFGDVVSRLGFSYFIGGMFPIFDVCRGQFTRCFDREIRH